MRKLLAAAVLSVGLILSALAGGTAEAGRGGGGGSSSGRSSSSGSSGRSYSSGASTSGRSYSSGASTSGRSYSSSRSVSGKSSSPSKPPVSSNPAHPSTKPNPSSPPPSTNPNKPAGGSSSGTSTKLYSSASNPSGNGAAAGRRYSSGDASPSGKSYATNNSSNKPSSGSFDATAARRQKMAESRVVYQKGQQPKNSYADRAGDSHPIDARDRKIESLRGDLNQERWENRQWREQQVFGRYYSYQAPPVVYHDPYSNFFWLWLLDRSLDTRANWAYNHRQSIDDTRYRDLLAHDANLEARIRQFETQQVARDPTYRPENIDQDLMYDKRYVEAAYNPQPAATTSSPSPPVTTAYTPSRPTSSRGAFPAMSTVFIVLGVMALIIWLVFYKRWGGIGG